MKTILQQKMRIRVSIHCEKCKKKAMQVAVVAKGVISVAIEGDSEDELVVVGNGVDAVSLVDALRKKACYATLETLEEVIPDPPADDQIKPQEDDDTNMPKNIETDDDNSTNHTVPPHCCPSQCSSFSYGQPVLEMYEVVVYDSYGPTTGCTIM